MYILFFDEDGSHGNNRDNNRPCYIVRYHGAYDSVCKNHCHTFNPIDHSRKTAVNITKHIRKLHGHDTVCGELYYRQFCESALHVSELTLVHVVSFWFCLLLFGVCARLQAPWAELHAIQFTMCILYV